MYNFAKGRWRVVAGYVFVLVVLACGLVLFHRFTELGQQLGWDGYAQMWITLGAGVLGFGAVLLQTRSSYQQLREQLDDQHRRAAEELERQRQAVAAALLAEVTDFCEHHIEPFISRDKEAETVKFIDRTFAVYEANTSRIGQLDIKTCEAVVHFYDRGNEHVAACHRYAEIAAGPPGSGESEESKSKREAKFFEEHLGEQRLTKLKHLAKEMEFLLAESLKGKC